MTPEPAVRPAGRMVAAFAAVYLIWGSTYLAIAFAIQTIPPLLMAGGRFLIAGAVMYLWARRSGPVRTSAGQWGWAFFLGAMFFLIGNGAVVWVEQELPSGLTALIIALVSAWTALLEWAQPGGHRPTGMVLFGVALGFFGVGLLVLPGGTGHGGSVGGVGLLVFSTFAWALASVLSRGADLPASIPLASAMQMLAGGVLLTVVSLAIGDWGRFIPGAVDTKSLLAFLYLVIFGSLLTFTAYTWLLKVTSPSKVATAGYVNPMVAVLLGWGFGGETLSARTLLAAAVIVGAVVLIITGKERARAEVGPSMAPWLWRRRARG